MWLIRRFQRGAISNFIKRHLNFQVESYSSAVTESKMLFFGGIMNRQLFWTALVLISGQVLVTSAMAGCQTQSSFFRLHHKKPIKAYSWVSSGSCEYVFSTGGRTTFTSASIVRKPKHGVFKKTARFQFLYTPHRNYKGKDSYSVRICGKDLQGKNCTELIVEATVK